MLFAIRSVLGCALLLLACSSTAATRHTTPCVDGFAEGYACKDVDLLAHLSLVELGAAGGNANDIWGWTDPETGKEYALVGLNNGTAFVDISDPDHVVRLGNLATHSGNSTWRGIKTYGNYAFIVSEAVDHGMQVFDLRRLRNVVTPPAVFSEDAWYGNFGRAHNIVINEQSGFAYAVGSRQGTQQCGSGLHIIDIHNPLAANFAGCFSADGYTHDSQCINYDGPDADFSGREVCFAANEDTITIVDVTNKASPTQISRTTYAGVGYTHQGWLTADRRHFLVDDELDEQSTGNNTRTYVWDMQDLNAPHIAFIYTGSLPAIDHNVYIHEGYAFESNYQSGLRILDLSNIDGGSLEEAAYFDTFPTSDSANFNGTWSNYPFYSSGVVGVSDINRGLFVLQPNLCRAPTAATGVSAQGNGDNRIDLLWNASATAGATYSVERILGGCNGSASETIASGLSQTNFSDMTASGLVNYGYRVRTVAASGECAAVQTSCAEATTTGTCTAAPAFAGVASAQSAGTASCAINLGWQSAQSYCAAASAYQVYRSENSSFTPSVADLVSSGIPDLSWIDTTVAADTLYTYVVRATDSGNGAVDSNSIRLSARATGPASDGDYTNGAEIGDPTLADNGGSPATAGVAAPTHVAWEIVSTTAHSGARSYFSGYNNSECLSISTASITLNPGNSPTLEFWTRYGIEAGFDGGVVQISTNAGQDWTTIVPVGGYPATLTNTGNACGLPLSSGAYSGTNLTWSPQQFNLSAYAGQNVRLRWRFGTDGGVTAQGWWIDDIRVTHTQVPGMCVPTSDNIFVHGFEIP